MRSITHAEYQLNTIMPGARAAGCTCPFSEADFDDFIAYQWWHNKGCPAPRYECLPNTRLLTEVMRAL